MSLCAEPSRAGRGALPAPSGGERGRPAARRARSSGAAGFSSDTHLGRVCLAPDRARLGKAAGRLGFVTALLGAGEARGSAGAPRVGSCAVPGLGEPCPGGCSISEPGVAAPLDGQCRGACWPHSGSGWSQGLWAMLAKLPSCLPPQVLPSAGSIVPAVFIART